MQVTADKKKGLLLLSKEADGVMHLKWQNRTSGKVEDDFLIMPTCQTFTKVDTGREADRVFLLQFENPKTRRFFFWSQDGDAEKSLANVERLDALMNKVRCKHTAAAVACSSGLP